MIKFYKFSYRGEPCLVVPIKDFNLSLLAYNLANYHYGEGAEYVIFLFDNYTRVFNYLGKEVNLNLDFLVVIYSYYYLINVNEAKVKGVNSAYDLKISEPYLKVKAKIRYLGKYLDYLTLKMVTRLFINDEYLVIECLDVYKEDLKNYLILSKNKRVVIYSKIKSNEIIARYLYNEEEVYFSLEANLVAYYDLYLKGELFYEGRVVTRGGVTTIKCLDNFLECQEKASYVSKGEFNEDSKKI